MALYERFWVIESWTFEKGVTVYQLVNVRVLMPDHAKAREGDVWGFYLSGEDLQRAVRSWPLGRYLRLSLSPGTQARSSAWSNPARRQTSSCISRMKVEPVAS